MAGKRYYWLKLRDNFFESKRIKKLRRLAGGDTYTIIYLKMQLLAMKHNGILEYTGLESTFAAELALDLDEEPDNVAVTINYLLSCGLLESSDEREFFLPYAVENVGSEASSTQRSRECRERNGLLPAPKPEAKTNAERQRSFRAKQKCEERHIPLIEDYVNRTRYNGNYYLAMQRDRYQCAMCGSTDCLCLHHIDGYDPDKLENSNIENLLVLCRSCHSKVHRSGLEIPQDILDAIGYRNESNVTCNGEKEIERRERERERERKEEAEEAAHAHAREEDRDEWSSQWSGSQVRECVNADNDEQAALGKVLDFYMDRINPSPSGMAVEALNEYTKKLGPEVVIHAMGWALDERKTSWSYINAILRRYVADGLTDMNAVLDSEQRHAESRNGGANAGTIRNSAGNNSNAGKTWDIHADVIA